MSAFVVLLCALWGGTPAIVDHGQPTGDLRHGQVLVERGVPSFAYCDDWGGTSITVDSSIWCFDENF